MNEKICSIQQNKHVSTNAGKYAPPFHKAGKYASTNAGKYAFHNAGKYAPPFHNAGKYAPPFHKAGKYAPPFHNAGFALPLSLLSYEEVGIVLPKPRSMLYIAAIYIAGIVLPKPRSMLHITAIYITGIALPKPRSMLHITAIMSMCPLLHTLVNTVCPMSHLRRSILPRSCARYINLLWICFNTPPNRPLRRKKSVLFNAVRLAPAGTPLSAFAELAHL
jgi:hypothetical protein